MEDIDVVGEQHSAENLLSHLETYCGRFTTGWTSENGDQKFQVLQFAHGPLEGSIALATYGLSRTPLALPGGRTIRQELIAVYDAACGSRDLPQVLMQVAHACLDYGRALAPHEVVRLPPIEGTGGRRRPFYVSQPVCFPEEFECYHSVVFPWLVPIHDGECQFIQANGWRAFVDSSPRESPTCSISTVHRWCDQRRRGSADSWGP